MVEVEKREEARVGGVGGWGGQCEKGGVDRWEKEGVWQPTQVILGGGGREGGGVGGGGEWGGGGGRGGGGGGGGGGGVEPLMDPQNQVRPARHWTHRCDDDDDDDDVYVRQRVRVKASPLRQHMSEV